MSALSRCLHSASQQFLCVIPSVHLNLNARSLVTSALLSVSMLGVSTMPAQAESVLPASSAAQWGDSLGRVAGSALGVLVAGTGATNDIARQAQQAVAGIGQEVGGNVGRAAAQKPYGNGENGAKAVPMIERDHLDIMGLNAILAHNQLIAARPNSAESKESSTVFQDALRNFEVAYRSVSERGFDVKLWADARTALRQPLYAVPQARFAQYASDMVVRLSRPDGPSSVEYQRQRIQQQQQPVPPQVKSQVPPVQQVGYQVPQPGSSLAAMKMSLAQNGIQSHIVPSN